MQIPRLINSEFALSPAGGAQIAIRHALQKDSHLLAHRIPDDTRNRHRTGADDAARLAHHHCRPSPSLLRAVDSDFVVSPNIFMVVVPGGPGTSYPPGCDHF